MIAPFRNSKFVFLRSIRSRLSSGLQGLNYLLLRIIGNAMFPIFGAQVPLRGYYRRVEGVCNRFGGHYIQVDQKPIHMVERNRLSSGDRVTTQDTFVGLIRRGRVIHDYGVVLTPDHKLVADVSPPMAGHPATHPILLELSMPRAIKLNSRIAIVTSGAHQRYFHWLFDILPRFDLIRRSKIHVDYYVVNNELPFQKESMKILEIPTAKIINPKRDTHIEAQDLIVPSLPAKLGMMTPRSCEFLRATFLPSTHGSAIAKRLIYITRKNALTRRVLNESELLARMSRFDVEAIELEGMSMTQQAELFASAQLIIAPHGAGIANAVFCPKDSKLIEFMPDTYNNPCFELLAAIQSLRYVRVPSHSTSSVTHDQYVNISNVESIIEKLLTTSD
jgi:capsular polysaccharide biosynthesis protein